MATLKKYTVEIPADLAAYIDAKVESGEYRSRSAVVRSGIDELRLREGLPLDELAARQVRAER
jgi:putative addiction module CopG family antidote